MAEDSDDGVAGVGRIRWDIGGVVVNNTDREDFNITTMKQEPF